MKSIFALIILSATCFAQDVVESFPYSFVHPPFISPHAIQTLGQPWPCCEENPLTAIEVWNSSQHYIERCNSSEIEFEPEGSRPVYFGYRYLGQTENGISVLQTYDCGGGTGIFYGLMFVTFEKDTYVIDQNVRRERIVMKRVGGHCLGDRWGGRVKICGNTVFVLTLFYQQGFIDCEPTWEALDLGYAMPSLALNLGQKQSWGSLPYAIYTTEDQEIEELLQQGELDHLTQAKAGQLLLTASQLYYGEKRALSLLNHHVPIDAIDEEGATALHFAIQKGHRALIERLIEEGADVNATNEVGWTPLYYAVEAGDLESLTLLIENGAKADLLDTHSHSPLWYALHHEYSYGKDIIALLFNLGAQLEKDPRALLTAAECGNLSVVQKLVEEGVEIECQGTYDNTPLLLAIRNEEEDVVSYLLEKGANPLTPDLFGRDPILLAIQHEDFKLMSLLIEKGAKINGELSKETPLFSAISRGWMEGIEYLLNLGVDVNAANASNGRTPLHAAAELGSLELVQRLVEKGANIAVQDDHRETPFLLAVRGDHIDLVHYLIEMGAIRISK